MRLSDLTAISLAWMLAFALAADLQATTLLPGEGVHVGQSADTVRTDPGQTLAVWDRAAAWIWSKHDEFAVLAMSIGTAMTIVTLAVLATKAREWASTLVAHRSPLRILAGGGVGAFGGAAAAVGVVATKRLVRD